MNRLPFDAPNLHRGAITTVAIEVRSTLSWLDTNGLRIRRAGMGLQQRVDLLRVAAIPTEDACQAVDAHTRSRADAESSSRLPDLPASA